MKDWLFVLVVLIAVISLIGQVGEVGINTELRARIQQLETERYNLNACQGDMRP